MAETVNQETATIEQNQTQEQQTVEEKLFTQDEVNKFFDRRYSETMSKLKEYEAKAKKYDELEEANKTELQKATEKAEKLQAELDSIKKANEVREMRDKVAQETGVPAHLLTAETEDECKAQAESIKEFAKPSAYPSVRDGGEPRINNKNSARADFSEWVKKTLV